MTGVHDRPASAPRATPSGPRRAPLTSVEVAAVPEAVGLTRRLLGTFAAANGAEPEQVGALCIAVSEAVSNVVRHAYGPGETGVVRVRAVLDGGALDVAVVDDGGGIRAGESEGLGLGLSMIASATTDFSIIQRDPRGTEVRMRFLLGS